VAPCAIVTPRFHTPGVALCGAIAQRDDFAAASVGDRISAILRTPSAAYVAVDAYLCAARSKKLSTANCVGTIFLRRFVNGVSAETRSITQLPTMD